MFAEEGDVVLRHIVKLGVELCDTFVVKLDAFHTSTVWLQVVLVVCIVGVKLGPDDVRICSPICLSF